MQTELFSDGITKSAEISNCGRYRYVLLRTWDDSQPIATFIMLNPSTADADVDDPTIRRCIGFAKSWGRGGVTVLNLFALRSTDPKVLWSQTGFDDTVGYHNDDRIRRYLRCSSLMVAAWGAWDNAWMRRRLITIQDMVRFEKQSLWCLGRTKNGSPRHPLYVPGSQEPAPFDF